MNKAWRRQSSAEWAARAVTDLCDENKAWTTGWHRLRAGSNAEFREAVAEAVALHAHDELFSKHIEPEPAPEDPVGWAMAEASDEDDAPMPDAPSEPELIDMPPAPASAHPMSNLERVHRSAPRVRRWTTLSLNKNAQPSSYHIVLSVVSRVRCPVCRVSLLSHVSVVLCIFVLCVLPKLPDSDKKVSVFCFFSRWPQKVLTQGDFCAML